MVVVVVVVVEVVVGFFVVVVLGTHSGRFVGLIIDMLLNKNNGKDKILGKLIISVIKNMKDGYH